jgi:WD40 repeat protein
MSVPIDEQHAADVAAQAIGSGPSYPTVDAQNPWPGAEAYDEDSSAFFYGRKAEAAELLRLIKLAPLTVLYGKSGLGKTSLLQAGLFPLLRAQHYLPVALRLDFTQGMAKSPLDQVTQHLTEALDYIKAEYPPVGDHEGLWEYLHRKDAEFWSTDNFLLTPVLILDQFEELFSRTGGNLELIRQVFNELADLIENRIPPDLANDAAGARRSRLHLLLQHYRVVLSFREDFLPDVRTWEKQVPSLLRKYLRLEPMSRDCAIDAVEQSGKAVLEPGVAPWIVDFVGKRDQQTDTSDVSDMVIEPVLLSLCCTQLNLRRTAGARIDKALVENTGQDILESFYRDALSDPEVKGQPDVASFIETYLIQGDHFRGDYPRQEAIEENKISAGQLAALTDRIRLLRIIHRADTARVELIHDRLVPVVRKLRDQRRMLALQNEQKRQAEQARAERDKERAYNAELRKQRDAAKRNLGVAIVLTLVALILGGAGWAMFVRVIRLKRDATVSWDTARLAEGRLALGVGREPLEQVAYRALAAYRLALSDKELSQGRAASLSALENVLDESTHLLKIIEIPGLMPTPAIAFSPDGKTIAVGSEDGIIRLLDAANYQVKRTLDCGQHAESVWVLAFNHAGSRVAAGYVVSDEKRGTGLICVFDLQGGKTFRWSSREHSANPDTVTALAYGGKPGNEFLVFGGAGKILRKLDLNTGHVTGVAQDAEISSVALSSDELKVATSADDRKLRIWTMAELDAQSQPSIQFLAHGAPIQQVVFSPLNPNVLISAGEDGRIRSWNLAGPCLIEQSKAQKAKIYNMIINPDGLLVASGGEDGYVRLFSLSASSKTPIRCPPDKRAGKISANYDAPEFDTIPEGVLSGHAGIILGLAFDPQGNHLASSGQDGSVRLWGRNTQSFSLASLTRTSPGTTTALCISRDAQTIVAGTNFGFVYFWHRPLDTGEPILQDSAGYFHAGPTAIQSMICDQIGDRSVFIFGSEDGIVRRWDLGSGKPIGGDMADSAGPIRSIALSPDKKILAAGSKEGTVRLWDVESGHLLQKIDRLKDVGDEYELTSVGFSSDGKFIAVGSGARDLRIVNIANGNRERLLDGHDMGITGLARSSRAWLLSSGQEGSVLEWQEAAFYRPQPQTIRKRNEFQYRMGFHGFRNPQPITSLDATEDGSLVLTGGEEGQIQLWDGVGHVLISDQHQLTGHTTPVEAVALSPDGSFFVTADSTKILVWPGPDRWADILCSRLLWNMSHERWREWVSSGIPYREQCPGLPVEPDESTPPNPQTARD